MSAIKSYTFTKSKAALYPNLSQNRTSPELSFAFQFSTGPCNGTLCSFPNQKSYHNPADIPCNSSFAITASNLWNCLLRCSSNISGVSVAKFKTQLDKFLDLSSSLMSNPVAHLRNANILTQIRAVNPILFGV